MNIKMRKTVLIAFVGLLIVLSCKKKNGTVRIPANGNTEFVSAVDLSSYPEISISNPTFYDFDGLQKDFLQILKENGINTVRLRLWVQPAGVHSGFDEVKQFSETLKAKGFKIWLTLHYSDTWADPGNQLTPVLWQGLNFSAVKETVYNYTTTVITQISPDFIQIGNEINSGLLHPFGNLNTNNQGFIDLIKTGALAVRQNSTHCKIILHFAGLQGADWFFNQVKSIDYDIIGLSYYPIWHGKSLMELKTNMQQLSDTYQKKIVIAETAYPFTLGWNDWTNNIVGQSDQLILPDYPATPEGQRRFINRMKQLTQEVKNGMGFCYWGAELISWKGNQSLNASPWENQALFDFNNKALPVLKEFRME